MIQLSRHLIFFYSSLCDCGIKVNRVEIFDYVSNQNPHKGAPKRNGMTRTSSKFF
jgi:hypothetical protein